MSGYNSSPIINEEVLSKPTVIFGLHMWVVVGICVGAAIVLLLFLLSLWIASKRPPKQQTRSNIITNSNPIIPNLSKEIHPLEHETTSTTSNEKQLLLDEESLVGLKRIHIEIGKDHRITYPDHHRGGAGSSGQQVVVVNVPQVSHLGWGHWYTLRELEAATNMFADDNVIGEGGYGIVYHGVLPDHTHIAVKNLLNNRGQAEREFKVEVWKLVNLR